MEPWCERTFNCQIPSPILTDQYGNLLTDSAGNVFLEFLPHIEISLNLPWPKYASKKKPVYYELAMRINNSAWNLAIYQNESELGDKRTEFNECIFVGRWIHLNMRNLHEKYGDEFTVHVSGLLQYIPKTEKDIDGTYYAVEQHRVSISLGWNVRNRCVEGGCLCYATEGDSTPIDDSGLIEISIGGHFKVNIPKKTVTIVNGNDFYTGNPCESETGHPYICPPAFPAPPGSEPDWINAPNMWCGISGNRVFTESISEGAIIWDSAYNKVEDGKYPSTKVKTVGPETNYITVIPTLDNASGGVLKDAEGFEIYFWRNKDSDRTVKTPVARAVNLIDVSETTAPDGWCMYHDNNPIEGDIEKLFEKAFRRSDYYEPDADTAAEYPADNLLQNGTTLKWEKGNLLRINRTPDDDFGFDIQIIPDPNAATVSNGSQTCRRYITAPNAAGIKLGDIWVDTYWETQNTGGWTEYVCFGEPYTDNAKWIVTLSVNLDVPYFEWNGYRYFALPVGTKDWDVFSNIRKAWSASQCISPPELYNPVIYTPVDKSDVFEIIQANNQTGDLMEYGTVASSAIGVYWIKDESDGIYYSMAPHIDKSPPPGWGEEEEEEEESATSYDEEFE